MPSSKTPLPSASSVPVAKASRKTARSAAAPVAKGYHHGALPEAVLAAAERVLLRDGIAGLGLRAIAREAGVSHTAPKHHFGDTTGLLSELAAVGFGRLGAAMRAAGEGVADAYLRRKAVGAAYVHFAHAHPAMFSLMFRNELVDMRRPSLARATAAMMRTIVPAVGGEPDEAGTEESSAATERPDPVTLARTDAMRITAAWAYVHGLATLLIDNRLRGVLKVAPDFESPLALVDVVLREVDMGLDFSAKAPGGSRGQSTR